MIDFFGEEGETFGWHEEWGRYFLLACVTMVSIL